MMNAATTWLLCCFSQQAAFFIAQPNFSCELMSPFISLTVTEKEVQQW